MEAVGPGLLFYHQTGRKCFQLMDSSARHTPSLPCDLSLMLTPAKTENIIKLARVVI